MSDKPEALRLAESFETDFKSDSHNFDDMIQAAAELRRLHAANIDCVEHFNAIKAERDELLAVLKELQESSAYWSEYDVPIGIVDRINAVIAKAGA
jgi:hypothetical protein